MRQAELSDSPDLLSAVIEFRPREAVTLRRETTGQLVHGAFLDLLKQRDRALSDALHAAGERKPFTLSTIRGLANGQRELQADRIYQFRVTALTAPLTECLAQLHSGELEMLGQRMPLVVIRSRCASSAALFYQHIASERLVLRRIGFRFRLPTLVECDHRACGLFPEPNLLFQHLAQKWLAHSYLPDDELGARVRAALADAPEIAARTLLVSRYNLRTEPVYFRGDVQNNTSAFVKIGYVGTIEYVASKMADPLALRVFHLLADYALFAGVGYHTTMGMGQVRPFWPRVA